MCKVFAAIMERGRIGSMRICDYQGSHRIGNRSVLAVTPLALGSGALSERDDTSPLAASSGAFLGKNWIRLLAVLAVIGVACSAQPIGQKQYVEFHPSGGAFALSKDGQASTLCVGADDWPGVERAAADLRDDLGRVTGRRPELVHDLKEVKGDAIIVGTIGKSAIVDGLIEAHKLDATGVAGKWESFVIQMVRNPAPGVRSALVIAGSDKRGAIFGAYDVSEEIGVSPWYWWADVPAAHHDALYVKAGRYAQGEPAVKYRGIFLNDESPDLSNWVYEKFGNYNHKFYVHVFELLLRLKANYLWPAMWNNSFNADDPLNEKLADEYGIVMGTSHVEPMMRADKEWGAAGYPAGDWRFDTHAEELLKFWAEGLDRSKPYEDIVTIAMRGKIDTPMSETANIDLLEKIVAAQRQLIAEHLNPDVTKVPQLWALYKEVQEYYDKGMRVPDDVTLLWCDDNWGDIRRLPTPEERSRSGGAGVYYHFDYVGGPRNYKWTNTNPLPKIWEQMNDAYESNANRIWIVNVGSLKPKEFPTEFFLNFAWDPKRWPKEKLGDFTRLWATREFGPKYATAIADIVEKYAKYNGRRKPELLDPDTYSVENYGEADQVVTDFKTITDRAEKIYVELAPEYRDAFYQLVLFPTRSSEIVNELYVTVAKNRLYARQGRVSENLYAEKAKELFKADADLADYFNHKFAGGRWDHFQDQTHIGYTSWQQPDRNTMPRLSNMKLSERSSVGVAVEGSESSWPLLTASLPALPKFDVLGSRSHYIDVFQMGVGPAAFKAAGSAPWIRISATSGKAEPDARIWVGIDWAKVPLAGASGTVQVTTNYGDTVSIPVIVQPTIANSMHAFRESDGYVSIEAGHFSKSVRVGGQSWETIPDYGRTLSGVGAGLFTSPSVAVGSGPHLEYGVFVNRAGSVDVQGIFGPSLSTAPGRGLRCAISFDDQAPQVVDIDPKYLSRAWETAVSDSVRKTSTSFALDKPGYHILKVWMIDPGVVLEKLVLDFGGVRPSYLGPPESPRG
jgi:hypothetical protein